jgi:uncharacterized protein DUF1501
VACLPSPGAIAGDHYGETDDYRYFVVKDPLHVHDLNTTILHNLAIEHTKLVFKFQADASA